MTLCLTSKKRPILAKYCKKFESTYPNNERGGKPEAFSLIVHAVNVEESGTASSYFRALCFSPELSLKPF